MEEFNEEGKKSGSYYIAPGVNGDAANNDISSRGSCLRVRCGRASR